MQNAKTIHLRWMARFLERRGWVVFYLDERAQFCPALKADQSPADCWMALWKRSVVAAKRMAILKGVK